jgi:hypothetical protein
MAFNKTSSHDITVSKLDKLKSCFNFGHDFKLGALGEKYVESILQNPNVKIEVKKDDWAIKSGNIAIEFESRGKPSGILKTESDFWCQVVGNFFVLMMPVPFLKFVYEKYKDDTFHVKSMGDRNADGVPTSKAILIPWFELIDLFKEYNKTLRV